MNKSDTMKAIKRQYVRHFHGLNIPIHKVILACLEEQRLEKFAWNYLSRRFGIHKFKHRYFKTGQGQIRCLKNDIKASYLTKYYHAERWSMKKTHLGSQSANVFLTSLLTNFGEYVKRLRYNYNHMSKAQKLNYETDTHHNNPYHHKWYHIGFFNYRARDSNKRDIFTVAIPNNNTIKVIGHHHIWCPSVGNLHMTENLKNMDAHDIRLIKIKVRLNHSIDVQFVFNLKYRIDKSKMQENAVGIDYNQHDNQILCLYDNQPNGFRGHNIRFSSEKYSKLEKLEHQIELIQSKHQGCLSNHHNQRYHLYEDKINYLKQKQAHVIDQEYLDFAHEIFDQYDCVCMEALNAKAMRQQGRGNPQSRSINNRLKTLKPYRLLQVFKDIAIKEHKEIIFVNSAYTTQVDYGTMIKEKHPVGVESWIHDGKKYLRDPNASHNILDWSLRPKHHYLYRIGKVKNPDSLVSVY